MKAIRFTVFGKVQGVFFRASTIEKAVELGIVGRVRNNTDGTVSVHAQGESRALIALENWLHDGPPQAHVERVESMVADNKGYESFEKSATTEREDSFESRDKSSASHGSFSG